MNGFRSKPSRILLAPSFVEAAYPEPAVNISVVALIERFNNYIEATCNAQCHTFLTWQHKTQIVRDAMSAQSHQETTHRVRSIIAGIIDTANFRRLL